MRAARASRALVILSTPLPAQVYRKALLAIHTDKLPEGASSHVCAGAQWIAERLRGRALTHARRHSLPAALRAHRSARSAPADVNAPRALGLQDQVLAQEVFDALRQAWTVFQHEL